MDSTIDQSSAENYEFRALTDFQKKALAILPIPSALLSIFGSTIIIIMLWKVRMTRSWIPYQRLLLAMSICDIISSLTLAIGSFLYPQETSDKVWAIGNNTSCSTIGFFNQLSYSGTLYNGMLSFYFLFTARFGMKNEYIQKRIEPAMHLFSIGFPLITAFVGLFLGVYAEPEVGIGCWVNRWPKHCGYGPDGTGEECLSPMVAWIFGAWIALGVLATLIVNNAVIWVFVHKRTKWNQGSGARVSRAPSSTRNMEKQQHDETSDSNSISHQSDDEETRTSARSGRNSQMGLLSMASSFRTLNSGRHSGNASVSTAAQREIQATQNRRLRLVGSQAFLFVGCYFVSNVCTYILRLFEAQASDYVEEKELPYHFYSLLVLQAILLPLQGLFNMMVYIRPKYLRFRSEFPSESKWSSVHRAIFGEAARTNDDSVERVTGKGLDVKAPTRSNNRGVSSLTINSELNQGVDTDTARSSGQSSKQRDSAGARSSYGDLSAILETSERGSERSRSNPIVSELKQGVMQRVMSRKTPNSQDEVKSRSSDSSLFMQGTGWSDSLESSSRSMQRNSIPENAIVPVHVTPQMPSGFSSSSDGSKVFNMHTGWSSSSDGGSKLLASGDLSTMSSKYASGDFSMKNRSQRESSSSFSTLMHTGWSDDSMMVEEDARRKRESMNVDAKMQQLMDLQFADDVSDSEHDHVIDLSQSLREESEEPVQFQKIAPKKKKTDSAQPSSEHSRDSFFMSTGWSSSLGDLATSKRTGATEPSSEHSRDSFFMPTGWSSSLGDLATSKRSGATQPTSEHSRDSFFMSTGWSTSLGELSNSVQTGSAKTSSSEIGGDSGRDSMFNSTGWSASTDNLSTGSPQPSPVQKLRKAPAILKSSKDPSATKDENSEGDDSLLELKTGWSMDDLPLVSSSPSASPNVSARKSTSSRPSNTSRISSNSFHMTIEEESSMDDLPLVSHSPGASSNLSRKNNTSWQSSASRVSSTSLHLPIEEESSMHGSAEDFNPEAEQSKRTNNPDEDFEAEKSKRSSDEDFGQSERSLGNSHRSATMIMMDGSFRSV